MFQHDKVKRFYCLLTHNLLQLVSWKTDWKMIQTSKQSLQNRVAQQHLKPSFACLKVHTVHINIKHIVGLYWEIHNCTVAVLLPNFIHAHVLNTY